MKQRIQLATLAVLLALAAPLAASEKIKLKSGKVVQGTAQSYDDAKQVLHFRLTDGKEMAYPLDQLDARSVYLVHASVVPKDNAKGQLQLANFARDAGIFEHAVRRYGYVEEADPSLKPEVDRERAKLRQMAADACMKKAQEARAKNDDREAEKWLKVMLERLPDEPQTVDAARLLEANYTKVRNEKQAKAEEELTEEVKRQIKPGKASYERMVENTKKGFSAKSDSQAAKLWKSAIQDGEKVLRELDKLNEKYGSDQRVADGVAKYRRLTAEQMIEANLSLASQEMVKSSFKQAQKYCNAALALDTQNPQALAMRARIETAANEGVFRRW